MSNLLTVLYSGSDFGKVLVSDPGPYHIKHSFSNKNFVTNLALLMLEAALLPRKFFSSEIFYLSVRNFTQDESVGDIYNFFTPLFSSSLSHFLLGYSSICYFPFTRIRVPRFG
jgi:hypothetical protein